MTFSSKEELIEKVYYACIDGLPRHLRHLQRKEIAFILQTLIESLPKPIDGYQNLHDTYYRQLLAMKD